MKNILYIFIVIAAFSISSCGNSSTKNSPDDSLTEFQRANLDTMNVENVVSEETEYIDTTKLFAEQEKQGARDIYAKYTFSDRFFDYTITLKTDNTVVFEKEKGPTSYGTWKSRYPDGIKLEFNYKRCPVVGGESCYISVIKDGYFYMDAQDANSKNPDMRLKLTKVQ